MGGSANIELTDREGAIGGRPNRRLLLIVSEDERYISASLAQAIRHEFPWLDVLFLDSIGRICSIPAQIVPLLLIDLSLFAQYELMTDDLRRAHPQASVAFLTKGMGSPGPDRILTLAGVRGVLPMTLPLDVWLAAVRVLMLGGEYFSAAFLMAAVQTRRDPAEPGRSDPCADNTIALRGLTAREIQILELVSRGQQNKLIASALGLSENTVKIHIHHIIAKLGVHNRTEAASFYLETPKCVRERAAGALPAGGLSP